MRDEAMARRHDELFKHTFGDPEHAANALQGILPALVVATIDWSSLEVLPGSFVDEALRERHTDLLYRVRIQGRKALIHLLFEHQSRPDPLMPLRIVEYLICGWRKLLAETPGRLRLPPIIPVVLYNGTRPWRAPTRLSEMFALDGETRTRLQPWLPEATFILHPLMHTADDVLTERFSAVVALVLGSLKHSRTPTALLQWFERSVELLRRLLEARSGTQALEALFRYAFTADLDPERLEPLVTRQLGAAGQEVFMTAADRLIEKGREAGFEAGQEVGRQVGREEGREEGRVEGRQEGRREGLEIGLVRGKAQLRRSELERLLALRFGTLDGAILDRVRGLADARVEALWDLLMSADYEADSIEALFQDGSEA